MLGQVRQELGRPGRALPPAGRKELRQDGAVGVGRDEARTEPSST